jgi:hypothetical protein
MLPAFSPTSVNMSLSALPPCGWYNFPDCEPRAPCVRGRMQSAKKRAEEYQTETTACLKVDDRMSIREDRGRMVGIAEHWLKLAAIAN